jgi:hypothetical protein
VDLDDLLPTADQVTRQATHIAAPPDAVWHEMVTAQLCSLPLTLLLAGARALPVVLTGKADRAVLRRPFLDLVPIPRLSTEAPSSVLYGGLLQPWQPAGGARAPELDVEALRAFSEPGWVKTGMEFRLAPRPGGTELSCQTRVVATDPRSRRRFARYWALIAPGSSAIRWELLAAVKQRAEFRVSRAAPR